MRAFITTAALAASIVPAAIAQNSSDSNTIPGYDCHPDCITPTIPLSNNNLTFGEHYAVLNLDMINAVVGAVATTAQGQSFIANTAHWIDTVHAQSPNPLSIFTRIYYSNYRKPEINANSNFAKIGGVLGDETDPKTYIYPAFHVNEAAGDVVLRKTGYYAGFGNSLEIILAAQGIDTVVLSGLMTSGVILSTIYRLYDLDYKM